VKYSTLFFRYTVMHKWQAPYAQT